MRTSRALVTAVSVLLIGALVFVSPPQAKALATYDTAKAETWLRSQQQADGGMEFYGVPGLETPDTALGVAQAHNAVDTWDPCVARTAADAVKNSKGISLIRYIDTFADANKASLPVVKAGELAILVSALGYNPHDFDAAGNTHIDLMKIVTDGANSDGSYGTAGVFGNTLFAVLALATDQQSISPTTIDYIKSTQTAVGGFNYAGDSGTSLGPDLDTTGRTLMALAAAGVPTTDDAVKNALAFVANQQQADGGFMSEYMTESNASTTALVTLGLYAYGLDPNTSIWRDNAVPAKAGSPYTSPLSLLAARQQADGHVATEYDNYGVSSLATSQSLQAIAHSFLPGITTFDRTAKCAPIDSVLGGSISAGYKTTRQRFAFADGKVVDCIRASVCTTLDQPRKLNAPIVSVASTSDGAGYWLFAADGGVFTGGNAHYYGSMGGKHLNKPIVDAKALPNDHGYILFASDGGTFTFGDAHFHGSGISIKHGGITGGMLDSTGNGYWLVGHDGGVFTFGDAPYLGSMGGKPIAGSIVSAESTRTGFGYYLFGSDGGVFSFGNASYAGSAADNKLRAPVIGASSVNTDNGYVMLASDGGTFTFGAAPFVHSFAPSNAGFVDVAIG